MRSRRQLISKILLALIPMVGPKASGSPNMLLLQGLQMPLGYAPQSAALSCKRISDAGHARGNGLYWLKGNAAPYQAYCDMTAGNAGWTLVMAAVNSNLGYDDALWTNATLQNEANYDTVTTRVSKYTAYLQVPFQELRSSDLSGWSANSYTTNVGSQSSAQALFGGAGIQISTSLSSYWNSRTPADGQSWGCTTYVNVGINQKAYLGTSTHLPGDAYCDWNGGARYGQRVNASTTGNHVGQGWGNYSTITTNVWNISQFLWVR
jgi:hypothetical protein